MLSSRQKRKYRRRITISIIAILIVLMVWLVIQKLTYRKPGFVRYPEFGISIPENYSIHGIDVSKYQSNISWEEVRLMKIKNIQLGFSFMKATEGIGNTDPLFKRNWKKAKEHGIIRGAYHFFIASKDVRMQAEHFINRVAL
jgi:lysozyme